MDDTDRKLITLLEADARQPTAVLARKLGLSRSTVQDRMRRLERRGIIGGYTIRLNDEFARRLITAHVMISVNPKFADRVVHALKQMAGLRALHAVSGVYDLIALIRAETTMEIDAMLDEIGAIDGIDKTVSSIVLSTKFER
ncbi:MAG: Lrp/AsnC family transcriptional regulator [Alphaproteobacteria bacterium]|nr:MAG: Lrp/AsnC family transcriptional regulator [Alphaproteobacteria bacterium]